MTRGFGRESIELYFRWPKKGEDMGQRGAKLSSVKLART